RRSRVDFKDEDPPGVDDVLDVNETARLDIEGDAGGVVDDGFDLGREEVEAWIDGERVAGVHAGAFDVLHDAGDQDGFAVADRVDFDFLPDQVLVDEDRMLRR